MAVAVDYFDGVDNGINFAENSRKAAKVGRANATAFDAEYEAFVKQQRELKAERLAKEAAKAEPAPQEDVAEVAYQAFVAEDEAPKTSKKKKKVAEPTDVVETTEVTDTVIEEA